MISPELLLEVFDKPICIHRSLLPLTKSVTAALFLTYAIEQMEDLPLESDGWFAKSQDGWESEIGLSRFEQEGARKILRQLELLEEKRIGMPAKMVYRVNAQKLMRLLGQQAKDNHSAPIKAHQSNL